MTVCCDGMTLMLAAVVMVTVKSGEKEKEEDEQGRRDVKNQTPLCILDQTP